MAERAPHLRPTEASDPAPTGLVDIHSHLIPGIDDGCRDLDDALACVRRLIDAGFTGSICTPHIWGDMFPENTPTHIAAWTGRLQQAIDEAGLSYRLWPGGEVRLHRTVVEWMGEHGVPTLAGSRCVLTDLWADRWPRWINDIFKWLIERGYQPILAHPERINIGRELPRRVDEVLELGVWLQGNYQCLTGEEGYWADLFVRQLLQERKYRFMALDMHRPETLDSRLDGMLLLAEELGPPALCELTRDAVRRDILPADA